MTSPAWVWVARFELAISRFQTERSRQIEPHPDGCRLRRKGSNLRRAGQSRVSYRWTTPERSSLRKESNLRTRAYEARLPPRSAAMQKKSGDKEGGDVACCSAAELPPGGARRAGVEPATRKVHVVPCAFTAGKRSDKR